MLYLYQSPMLMNLTRSSISDTINIEMNEAIDRSIVMNNWATMPYYDTCSFSRYPSAMDYSYMLNPQCNQMPWGNQNWNFGFNNNWMFNQTYGNGYTPSSNNNNDSTKNKQYNRLHTLLKQIVKAEDIFHANEIDTINEALRNTKGTAEEKYERLLEAYNTLNKDDVRLFLSENGGALGVCSDLKGKDGDDSFYKRLLATGFQYEDTTVDDLLEEFHDGIASLDKSDCESVESNKLIGLIKEGNIEILDFISSWNTYFKDDSDSARLMEYLGDKYEELDDESAQDTYKRHVLKPIVNALISKANDAKSSLDSASKTKLNEAIEELRDALNDTDTNIDGNLSSAFDTVYLYTRQATLAELADDAKNFYGEIDSVVFNESLFEQEMINDLEEEGFYGDEIDATKVTLSKHKRRSSGADNDDNSSNSSERSSKPFKGIDNKTTCEQLSILQANDVLEKLNFRHNNSSVWQEVTMSGDSDGDGTPDYAKLFYINNDGKIVEWTNTKLDEDGDPTKIDSKASQEEVVRKASEIANGGRASRSSRTSPDKDENFDPKAAGKDVVDLLKGRTGHKDEVEIEKILKNIDKDNVLEFLISAYDNDADKKEGRGLIEKLREKGDVSEAKLISMIEELIKVADRMPNIKDSKELKDLKQTLKDYEKDKGDDTNGFNNRHKDASGWQRFWGTKDYEEVIDDELHALVMKMKKAKGT